MLKIIESSLLAVLLAVATAFLVTAPCHAGPDLGENVALGATATMSSECCEGLLPGSNATDGNLDGSPAHTNHGQNPAEADESAHVSDDTEGPLTVSCIPFGDFPCPHWIQVELGTPFEIGVIRITGRRNCCHERMRDLTFLILTNAGDIVHQSDLLNPENVLENPDQLVWDVAAANGGNPVTGQIVRVVRTPDPDLSGATAAPHPAEEHNLELNEIEVFGAAGECPVEGDTHCDDLVMTGPPGDGPGTWQAFAIAEDDSGDRMSYFFEFDNGEDSPIEIASLESTIEVPLGEGNWIGSVRVDDVASCPDEATDATCTIDFAVAPCPESGDTFCDDILLISSPTLGGPGKYEFQALGSDEGLDFPLYYTFTADNGVGPAIVLGPQIEDKVEFSLSTGTWQISVVVDDLPECPDTIPEGTCTFQELTIGASVNLALGTPSFQSSDCCLGLGNATDGETCSTMHTNDQQDINQFAEGQPGAAGAVICSPFLDISPSVGGDEAYPSLTCPHALWVDLQGTFEISVVRLWNRGLGCDPCCQWRHRDFVVAIYPEGTVDVDGNFNNNDPIWVSPLLNPDNALAGRTADGPSVITLDIYDLNDNTPISGGVVHVVRLPDLDFSGTQATPGTLHIADATIMQIGELEVFTNRDLAECGSSGDSNCNDMLVTSVPPDNGPGNYEFEVLDADDDSDDALLYTFTAQAEGKTPLSVGPQPEPFATLRLGKGNWTISAIVDDDILCRNVSGNERCTLEVMVSTEFCPNPGEPEHSDTVCEELTLTRLGPGRAELPGEFTATLLADDDTGSDPLYYHFGFHNVDAELRVVAQPDPGVNTATVALGPGTWTVTASVNDSPVCLASQIGEGGESAGVCTKEVTLVGGRNIAPEGVATHSSTCCGTGAEKGNDGTDNILGGLQHTNDQQDPDLEEDDPSQFPSICIPFMGTPCMHWWQVEFETARKIELVSIFNRDGCCGDRLRDIVIQFITNENVIFESEILNAENELAKVVDGQAEPPVLDYIDVLTLDLIAAAGGPVSAEIVRIFRIPDPDFSGADPRGGSPNHIAEARVLQMAEVRIFESALPSEICDDSIDNDEDGDTDCDDTECATVAPCAVVGTLFRRGDCDQSGKVDFNDAIYHLRFLFLGENEETVNSCKDACDSDDSGADDFTDDINTLKVLFLGQGNIPAPGPLLDETHPCGTDPTVEEPEELTCDTYAPTTACP